MRTVFKSIYGVFGAGAIALGLLALISPGSAVNQASNSFLLGHLVREEAAAAIFIGLMLLWCIFNYERRAGVHYALMVFAFLLAAIHWFDYLSGHLRWLSPLFNSVPFLTLLVMLLLDRPAKQSA